MAEPFVAIVLLHWNNEPATRRALESLRAVTAPAHRVYVVDNGSTDGSADRLEGDATAPAHAWIKNGANLGFAAGCNRGIARALEEGAASVLLLNNDCVVTDADFLARLVAVLARDPSAGLVSGKILCWPDTSRIWSVGGEISPWRQRYTAGIGEPDRGQYDRPERRTFLSGGFVLVTRAVFERVGLLPEAYFFGHEDWEYGLRAHRAGFTLWYEPGARVAHEAGGSHDSADPTWVYNDALSRMLFEKRNLSPAAFRLWCALYGAYVSLALPLLYRVASGRYQAGLSRTLARAAFGDALRDIEWADGVTLATLDGYRRRLAPPATRGLRVAHVVATSGRTGVEAYLLVLFEALRAAGHDPYVVTAKEGPLTATLRERGFEVRLAAPRRRFGFGELPRLGRALDGADVVHAHGPRPTWWLAALATTRHLPPTVASVHQFAVSGAHSAWRHALYAWIERRALRTFDQVIAVSSGLARVVQAATGIAPARLHAVPNSAPLLLTAPGAPLAPDAPARVVVIARLSPEKGVDVALDAWADPRLAGFDATLHVVGDGPERAALEARAQALGLGARVRFVGQLDDVRGELAGALALVAPSRVETFGIVSLEAMALGVPVVATDTWGHRDLFGPGLAERLVPPDDPAALAAVLASVLADPARARADALPEQRRVTDAFSPARLGERTVAVYREALATRRARG